MRAPPTAPSQTVIKPPRICPEIMRPGLIPAASGTADRSGPKNRPRNMPAAPHRLKKASPLGSRSGRRDRGQMRASACSDVRASTRVRRRRTAPSVAENQIGQNPISAAPISAPMPNKIAVAGSRSDTNASNSPKARTKTIGLAKPSCSLTNVTTLSYRSLMVLSSDFRFQPTPRQSRPQLSYYRSWSAS